MLTIRRILCAATVALAVVLGLQAEARAQFYQFATIESVGGFTAYNQTTKFWAYVSAGRIRRGYVLNERRFHGQDTVYMTGTLTPRETYDLWLACYRARPWDHREVRANFVNVDLPDTVVTYMGRYEQRIRAGMASAVGSSLPVVSQAMEDFTRAAWDHAQQTAEGDLFVYVAQGGLLGYHRTVTVRQDGRITDEVTYAVHHGGAQDYTKQGHLGAADLNALKDVVYAADWWNLPGFQGNPMIADGIDETATYSRWGVDHEVTGGWPANRTAAYQAVLDKIRAYADRLP